MKALNYLKDKGRFFIAFVVRSNRRNQKRKDYFAGLALQGLISKIPLQDKKGELGNYLTDSEMNNFIDEATDSAWGYANSMIKTER